MEFDGALTYVRETLKFHGEDITSFQVTDAHGDVTEAVRGALAIEYAYRRGEAHSSFSELVYDPVEDAAQAFDQS